MKPEGNDSQDEQDRTLMVHAYLDGQLDPINALAVKRQIDHDPELSAELAGAQALQNALRARFPHEAVSEGLRRRIDAAIAPRTVPARPSWSALAASVLLAISLSSGATWIALHEVAGNPYTTGIVDSHMRSLAAASATDVESSERHIVKPWFNGRVTQAPRVVDLGPQGFPLKGARIDVIERTAIPTLVYARRRHVISLMALPASAAMTRESERSVNGFNIVRWTDGATSYWATSDLNAQELETFAKLFREAS